MMKKLLISSSLIVLLLLYNALHAQQNNSIRSLVHEAKQLEYSDTDKAWELANKAEQIARENALDSLAFVWLRKGYISYIKGNTTAAMELSTNAFKELSEKPLSVGYIETAILIGLVHLTNKNYETAENYFLSSLNDANKLDNDLLKGVLNLNLAVIQSRNKNYEKALEYGKISKDYLEEFPEVSQLGIVYNQLGYDLIQTNKLDSALKLFNYNIQSKNGSTLWNRAYAHTGKSLYYLKKQQYDLAQKEANISRVIADSLNALRILELTSLTQYMSAKSLNNFVSALGYYEEYQNFKDSLSNLKHKENTRILQAEIASIEKAKYDAEIALASVQKRNYLNVLFSLIAFIIVLFTALLFYRKTLLNAKQLNEDLQDSNELIKAKSEELSRLNKEKTRLFSIISHDLRGPFNSVQQILDMFKGGDLDKAQHIELMELLANQVDKTRSMLNELLGWANSQLDGSKTEKNAFTLKALIKSVSELYADAFILKSIDFKLDLEETVYHILGDKNQIKIILQNLISNALKFTPSNGSVTIRKYSEKDQVIIQVIDTGLGFNTELFGSLNTDKLSSTTKGTQQEEGTGLGLVLVKQFALNNNIEIKIDSQPNKGSVFTLIFKDLVQQKQKLQVA